MQLMGRQNLSLYKDWKGDEAAVQREFERNKEIGLKTGCWKANMLVSDDNGGVWRESVSGRIGDNQKGE
jgi:hypothetical protein